MIIHYRVGKTDGVSIEIDAWKSGLEKRGATVKLGSGKINQGADFMIEGLEHELDQDSALIDSLAFSEDSLSEEKLILAFQKHSQKIKAGFDRILEDYQPDLIIVSNLLSVGENLPAATALTESLDNFKIPTLAVHHDFYWENCRYRKPSQQFISRILEEYLPPKRPWIGHCCINSIGQEELLRRRGIEADLLFDNIDFNKRSWEKSPEVTDFLKNKGVEENDIVLMQATRIVRRKNIELAIRLVEELQKEINQKKLAASPLFNGRRYDPKRDKIILLLTGYAEKRDEVYRDKLIDMAKKLKVNLIQVGNPIEGKRSHNFSLEDFYPYGDLITYPSQYEGFGNQFLEACFAKKPVAAFEYPVFQKDIKTKGFEIISLGSELIFDEDNMANISKNQMEEAVNGAISILTNTKLYRQQTEANFNLAKKYFSLESAVDVIEKEFGKLEELKTVVLA